VEEVVFRATLDIFAPREAMHPGLETGPSGSVGARDELPPDPLLDTLYRIRSSHNETIFPVVAVTPPPTFAKFLWWLKKILVIQETQKEMDLLCVAS
jgi:hypothetical protein